jgi:hypothetical protein
MDTQTTASSLCFCVEIPEGKETLTVCWTDLLQSCERHAPQVYRKCFPEKGSGPSQESPSSSVKVPAAQAKQLQILTSLTKQIESRERALRSCLIKPATKHHKISHSQMQSSKHRSSNMPEDVFDFEDSLLDDTEYNAVPMISDNSNGQFPVGIFKQRRESESALESEVVAEKVKNVVGARERETPLWDNPAAAIDLTILGQLEAASDPNADSEDLLESSSGDASPDVVVMDIINRAWKENNSSERKGHGMVFTRKRREALFAFFSSLTTTDEHLLSSDRSEIKNRILKHCERIIDSSKIDTPEDRRVYLGKLRDRLRDWLRVKTPSAAISPNASAERGSTPNICCHDYNNSAHL